MDQQQNPVYRKMLEAINKGGMMNGEGISA